MRSINTLFLCLLLTFSSFAFAQVGASSSDLQSRVQSEIDNFKRDIETLRGAQLINACDLLTGSGLSDSQLYATVEAKTKLLIAAHLSSPKDDELAKELNAMIRALGSMGLAAKPILDDLVTSSSSTGLRNRAFRVSPKLDWFAQRNTIMQKPDLYQAGQDLMTHRYLNLLTADDYTFGRWGMEELARRGGAEPIVYKKMAEILDQQRANIKAGAHLDYLAWICKTLSRYDAKNSAELLNFIKNNPSKDKNAMKLKRWVLI